jgi:hypothetical protein
MMSYLLEAETGWPLLNPPGNLAGAIRVGRTPRKPRPSFFRLGAFLLSPQRGDQPEVSLLISKTPAAMRRVSLPGAEPPAQATGGVRRDDERLRQPEISSAFGAIGK